jgi:hypothetical protein
MSLTGVIYGCIVMTYGARQRCPKSGTSESRSPDAAAVRSTARCGGAFGARLLHFSSTSLSLSAASPAVERSSTGKRSQAGIHGKAPTEFDSAGAVVRICQKNLDQRSRDPSAVGAPATRGRSWLSRSRSWRTDFSWSITLIACCQTNWLKCISCSCPVGGELSEVCPPNPIQLLGR